MRKIVKSKNVGHWAHHDFMSRTSRGFGEPPQGTEDLLCLTEL